MLIDKPAGITSAKAVAHVKRALRARRVGHAGTLDPLATGLLIIGVNAGTKKLAQYLKLPKTYEAQILFGKRTDTGDLEGKVLEEVEGGGLQVAEGEVKAALAGMVGTLELSVSPYSALKRSGEPLYKKARRGEVVEPVVRAMEVRAAEVLGITSMPASTNMQHSNILQNVRMSYPVVSVRFDVGSGTYIRSLAEELGHRLGVPATLAYLRRTRVGECNVVDAQPLTDFE